MVVREAGRKPLSILFGLLCQKVCWTFPISQKNLCWMVFKAPKTTLEIPECSVQVVPAPCYSKMQSLQAFLLLTRFIGKEIRLHGVPGWLPSHTLSIPR